MASPRDQVGTKPALLPNWQWIQPAMLRCLRAPHNFSWDREPDLPNVILVYRFTQPRYPRHLGAQHNFR